MASTFVDAVQTAAQKNRERLLAQLHRAQPAPEQPGAPAPTESQIAAQFAAQGELVLVQSWFTVTFSTLAGLKCTCSEFRQYHFCEHARDTWRRFEPARVKLIA